MNTTTRNNSSTVLDTYNATRDSVRAGTATDPEDKAISLASLIHDIADVAGKSNPVSNGIMTIAAAGVNGYNYRQEGNASNGLALVESAGQIIALIPAGRVIGTAISVIAGTASVITGLQPNSSQTGKDNNPNSPDNNNSPNNSDSSSSSSVNQHNNTNNSPSEPYEPPPPKRTYKIEFDDGRPTTYTNNPFKDEYKGGKVSIIGFDDREYPVDPILVDLNQPDWKKQVDEIAEKWRNGNHNKNKYYLYNPMVLDLDGDGIETLAHNKNKGAMFDFNADGLRNATGWVKADDGILVFDRNNNGLVDNGAEVFGDSTIKTDGITAQHGFDALSDLDDNHDGRIDALDTHFNDLKVA